MNLSVMTFNLRYNESKDGVNAWPNRVNQVIELLEKHLPVVIGTQEGLYPMLLDMGEGLPRYSWVGQGRGGGESGEFNAIFYLKEQVRLIQHGQFWLSERPEEPGSISWDSSLPRICTWAHLKSIIQPDTEFMVFNTHLDHLSEKARYKGIELILQQMQKHFQVNPVPMVLMGDFNSEPDSDVIMLLQKQLFTNAFDRVVGEIGSTFHGFHGENTERISTIDYVFAAPLFEIKETTIIREHCGDIYPSDHYPVLVQVEKAKGEGI